MSAVCDQLTEQQAEFFKTLLAQMRFEMRKVLKFKPRQSGERTNETNIRQKSRN
jgi:hypothetical protein